MSKSKKTASTMTSQQLDEEHAKRTILGLNRPKPFAELTSEEKIEVLCVQLKQLRGQFQNLRSQHHILVGHFNKHKHLGDTVALTIDDIQRVHHDVMDAVSEFDPLR